MKNALLNIVMVLTAACCCMSCINDHYPEPAADENQVTLAFNMRLLGYGSTRAGEDILPAERIRSLRVVLVDLGIGYDGTKEAEPQVEYNRVMNNVSVSNEDGVVSLKFPKIRADRRKKVYLLINSEQSYLNLKWNGQTATESLNTARLYLPDGSGTVPIEEATFLSPKGSHSKNDIEDATAELLVPMTAFHTFSVPDIKTLENLYPLQTNMVYTVPDELYVVRAINKITFDFVNATKDAENDGMELLVKQWSISKVNTAASYLFAHPGANGTLFDGADKNGHNAPWMQWLKDEADRSQSGGYAPQWLTEYAMPAGASHGEYRFAPADPQKNEGYILAAPVQNNNTAVAVSTEDDPVYFAESRPADSGPQQYELSFTVMQKENGVWNNEYTYRATSTVPGGASEWTDFNLQSLFRSTHVKVTVTFRSGLGHPDFEIDVHPYGGYELNPDFGL